LLVEVDKRYFRPTEVDLLIGDASKAKREFGWSPKYTLQQMVAEMVNSDLLLFKRDQYLKKGGHDILDYHE